MGRAKALKSALLVGIRWFFYGIFPRIFRLYIGFMRFLCGFHAIFMRILCELVVFMRI